MMENWLNGIGKRQALLIARKEVVKEHYHSLSERYIKEGKEDTGNMNECPNRNGSGSATLRVFKSWTQIVNSEKPLH